MDMWTRASDADRERVAAHLQHQVAEGRLTLDEFSERVAAADRARTVGELADLTRDLSSPALPSAARKHSTLSAPLLAVATIGLLALVLLVGGMSAAHAMGPMTDCMGR
ncbi:hypothetical protein BJF85_05130 [Saccharomonospora sp. CUA-673]|uniref:DUF1707 SHOCT-like domain-containing protein n=1 Tax=Saccharomonospora sp. CUA-673 TaxID=1904969 RepID=UPI000965B79F|nr:DUF1707 domain-containing protein [Saccharomonospora sp. CUA-673]OLT41779.1 hypothetical protein BJF85_05130 [Saccharomonospora sp. CUA-673]